MALTTNAVVARLDEAVDQFWRQTRWFHLPVTLGRARMFVLQHRQNSRYRNSVLKVRVASNVPDWDLRMRILHAVSGEIIADHEFAHGKPHWQIMKELGLALGLSEAAIDNARPIPSTRLAWLAWEGLMSNHHWLEGVVGATIAERINLPGYGEGLQRERGNALVELGRWQQATGLSAEQLEFWSMHADADREHSDIGWHAVARYAEELNVVEQVVAAAHDTLNIWSLYFDGIGDAGDELDRDLTP